MKSGRKSRDLDFYEYFIILQKEYIVAELRSMIYEDEAGISKSFEIMKGKKEKIKDISIQNSFKTIFEDIQIGSIILHDENLKKRLYGEIYNNKGFPNFIYRDEEHENNLKRKDYFNYYKLGSKMTTDLGVGTLQFIDFATKNCIIKFDNKIENFTTDEISRTF